MWRSGAGSVPHVPPGLSFDEKDEGAYSAKSNKPYPLLKQHTAIGLTTVPETTFPKEQSVSLNSLQMKFECGVCLEGYSESGSHAPRSLSCGHTFCTGRFINIISKSIFIFILIQVVSLSWSRKPFHVQSVTKPPSYLPEE